MSAFQLIINQLTWAKFSILSNYYNIQQSPPFRLFLNYIILNKKSNMQSRKGWSQIQDDRLMKIIKKYGMKNWTLISDKLTLGSTNERTGKQCRQRWHNHLNPLISNKEWSKKDDQILFDSHRKYGSKWKEISKLFQGRTDNSIKNHFYSTVRRCLRKISKLSGEKQTTITMKSIKPYVLSKIVQNTELTNLILKIGRNKSRNNNDDEVEFDQGIVNHVCSQLKRISLQYQQKKLPQELNKKSESSSNKYIESSSSEAKIQEINHSLEVKKLTPQDEALKSYFEQQSCKQDNERQEFILQTQQESKQRHQNQFEFNIQALDNELHKLKQTAEKQENQYIWIEEEQSRNFFNSPSCSKTNKFPDLRLMAKISRNSVNSQSQGEDHINPTVKAIWKEQKMEIEFDPQLLNASFPQCKQQNDRQ